LCGWESLGEAPSEATFSRAFDAFARDGRPQQIHEATITVHYGEKIQFSPAEALRYNERSSVERVNSHLHEEHGGRHVRMRGPVKVAAHLAFGLLVIAAEQMLKMIE
jgi:hypothetical protein